MTPTPDTRHLTPAEVEQWAQGLLPAALPSRTAISTVPPLPARATSCPRATSPNVRASGPISVPATLIRTPGSTCSPGILEMSVPNRSTYRTSPATPVPSWRGPGSGARYASVIVCPSCVRDAPIASWAAAWANTSRAWNVGAAPGGIGNDTKSEEHTSELQSHVNLVCRLLLEKKKKKNIKTQTNNQKKKQKKIKK